MYTLNHQLTKIVSIQGGAISSHSCRQKKLFEELKVTRNEEELQLRLANELGRPFNRILPITLILNKHNFSGEVGALLMFEHQLGGQELHKFMEFITERLQAVSIAVEKLLLEDDFIENSKLWEYTFDGVENPIAIVDENFNLLRSNTHFQKNNKFTNCYEIFQGREAPCTGCPMSPNKNESAGFVSKNEKTYQVFSYPIKFESQSKVKVFVNYYLDVTRTKALQSKVIQNEKVAAIGHLAGNIAHELNNPLSGIKAMTQFLLQEIVDDKSLRDDINEVNKAVVRCQQIISNLLDFTKEGEAEDEEGSLTDLVATTLPLLKTILSDHNVEINLSNSVGKIKGSMPLIQQVIFNLVKNACQAIKVGPGSIQISTGSNDDYWSWFEIRDSGAGMSPGVIESIFEPFYTTKKEGDGTGLGLFISKNIVDKFKGTIEIKSHLGEGTTFKVSFPKINHKEIA